MNEKEKSKKKVKTNEKKHCKYRTIEELVEAVRGRMAFLASNQHIDLVQIVARSQKLLDEHFAQKTGGTRYKYGLVFVKANYFAWQILLLLLLLLLISHLRRHLRLKHSYFSSQQQKI